MKKKNQSIRMCDIAQQLGISVSTVSKAMKGSYDVSQATQKRVMELVRKLDYEPNRHAQSLYHKRSYTIGVVVPELDNNFFGAIIRGMENIAYKKGYNLMICQSSESTDRELSDIRNLINNQVDGLVLALASETEDLRYLEKLLKRGFPIVLIDRGNEELSAPQILVDDFGGAVEATEHLIRSGCQRLAHLAGPPQLYNAQKRQEGFEETCRKHSLPQYTTRHCAFNMEDSFQAARQLLEENESIDGVFAASDRIAIGAMTAAKEMGKKIPEDISIIGFSDLKYSKLLEPSLTTLAQPAVEMGKKAIQELLQHIEDENRPEPKKYVFKTKLVIRKSTRSCPVPSDVPELTS
ncbi:MAG: LacI family transcriptional regulator [Cytophagales bacterium]|nr:LacI family transcriptional regulator [Cytophagales bacterium]